MSKKDYIAIAGIMRSALMLEEWKGNERYVIGYISGMLASYFGKDNPNFKIDEFREACEKEPNRKETQ